MRIGILRIIRERGAVRGLRLRAIAGLLQGVPVLDPDRWVIRITIEGRTVKVGRELPSSHFAGTVSAHYDRGLAVAQQKAPVPGISSSLDSLQHIAFGAAQLF